MSLRYSFIEQLVIKTTLIALMSTVFVSTSAHAQQQETVSRVEAWHHHQQMRADSQFADLEWQRMGPKFAGGRIESIDAPRGQLGTFYVGVGSGGIWKTINAGLTWTPIFENESTFAIGDLTIAPSNPETIWVGTGECHIGRMSYAGTGVFKSLDGGESWKNMGLHQSFHIGQVAIDPVNEDTVYIASMGSRSSGGERGIYKTTDGGATFRIVLSPGDKVSIVDLVIDPSNRKRMFASSWDRGRGNGSGVYRSDDQGETWKRLGGGLPEKDIDRVAIAVSSSKPGVVYALMADRSSPKLAQRRPASILFRSDDYGDTWNRTHDGYVPTYVGWDFCDVRVAVDDENLVYIGGFRLITSRDGGKTFIGEGGLAPNRSRENVYRLHAHTGIGLHLDVHDIWLDPENPERVMLGNDGGLFLSHDRGDTWLHLNNLPIAEYYRVHLDEKNPFQVWGGTQDNASLVGPSTARFVNGEEDDWKHVFLDPWSGGDGFSTFPDPNDPETIYFTQQNGALRRATAGELSGSLGVRPRNSENGPELNFAWDTPFFASKHTKSTVLYCAAQMVMRSYDRGRSWKPVSPAFGRRGIKALSESPIDANKLIVGDGNSKVHTTTDGGETWKDAAKLPSATIQNVLASIHDPNRVFVMLSRRVEEQFEPYVFVSNDFGKSWQSIANDLPHESVNVLCEDPQHNGILYVGTDLGSYVSIDNGASWQSLSKTLPTATVADLKIHSNGTLVAATHGLSIFSLDTTAIRAAFKSKQSADD